MTRDREFDPRALIALLRTAPRFELGRIVATPNALDRVPRDDIDRAIFRHHRGDWGELDDEDKEANDAALTDDARVLSAYTAGNGTTFWLITEADRSVTTVLLPEDY